MNAGQAKDFDVVDSRGLRCPKCQNQRFRGIYTRARRGGIVMRRRRCLNCGARLTTWERVIGS